MKNWLKQILTKIRYGLKWFGYYDQVEINVFGIKVGVIRKIPPWGSPYELTVVLPRIEFRKKCPLNSDAECQYEMILNSITIAHSPREMGCKKPETIGELPKNK